MSFNEQEPIPVTDTPFEPIVAATEWDSTDTPDRLWVAGGWLVTLDAQDQVDGLVGFSPNAVDNSGTLLPPRNAAEVRPMISARWKPFLFNTTEAAKGLGLVVGNTAAALQPHSVGDSLAVRTVAIRSDMEFARLTTAETTLGRYCQMAGHALRMVGAGIGDLGTFPNRGGTEWMAKHFAAQHYGVAPLVKMDLPPIWQEQQNVRGVEHPIPPEAVLVRGGGFAEINAMQRIGVYQVSAH